MLHWESDSIFKWKSLVADTYMCFELQHEQSLFEDCLQNVKLTVEDNELRWRDNSNTFYVPVCYRKILDLDLKYNSRGVCLFNWDTIWLNQINSKICFFLWLLVRKKVLTHEYLRTSGVAIVGRCAFCLKNDDEIEQSFVTCKLPMQVWSYFCSNGNVAHVLNLLVVERIKNWSLGSIPSKGKCLWSLLPHAII